MLFSSLTLLLLVVASSTSVSARPLPSYEIPSSSSSSVQLVKRQEGLLGLLGLINGNSTDAVGAVQDAGGSGNTATTTTAADVKGSAAVAAETITKESPTTTTTLKVFSPTTTATTARQAQFTTSQAAAVVVVGGTTTSPTNTVVVATASSLLPVSSSPSVLLSSSSPSPATISLPSSPSPDANLIPAADNLASSYFPVASHTSALVQPSSPSASSSSSSSNSTLLSSSTSTTPPLSPFSPKSTLFPLLITGLVLGSLLVLGLLFLLVKRIVIPSSKKSKRWVSKEGEEVLPWNELGGGDVEDDLTHGRGALRERKDEDQMEELGRSTRIGETAYAYPQSRGIASSEGPPGFVLGSYQSSTFDRDARVLPNNYNGGLNANANAYGGEAGGDQVVGWGDAIGAMENRVRVAGGAW